MGDCCDDICLTNFAAAIEGASTIRSFHSGNVVPEGETNTFMSTLAYNLAEWEQYSRNGNTSRYSLYQLLL
jgi:hypothetical protein